MLHHMTCAGGGHITSLYSALTDPLPSIRQGLQSPQLRIKPIVACTVSKSIHTSKQWSKLRSITMTFVDRLRSNMVEKRFGYPWSVRNLSSSLVPKRQRRGRNGYRRMLRVASTSHVQSSRQHSDRAIGQSGGTRRTRGPFLAADHHLNRRSG